jgi:hypothetical protein
MHLPNFKRYLGKHSYTHVLAKLAKIIQLKILAECYTFLSPQIGKIEATLGYAMI